MHKIINVFILLNCALLGGCVGSPLPESLVGTWIGPDKAQVTLNADNTFLTKNLPYKIFDNPLQQGEPISGSGKWKVEGKSVSGWEIWMNFSEESGKPSRRQIRVNIAGSKSSFSLFQWVDQEGGDRYELVRK